jgi:hypothetical protein
VGAAYDDGVWLAQTELGHTTSTSDIVPHGTMAYVGGGRRFGDWLPYVLLSATRPGSQLRTAANDWGAFNSTLRDPAIFTVNTTRMDQNTISLGARWDFSSRAALKLQWDSTLVKASGYGLWWRDPAVNGSSNRINLFSLNVDFAL